MFYFGVLPLSIVALILFSAFLYEESVNNQELRERIGRVIGNVALAIGSYVVAGYYYVKCNKIETHPGRSKGDNGVSGVGEVGEEQLYEGNQLQEQQRSQTQLNQLHNHNQNSTSQYPPHHFCPYCQLPTPYRTRHCRKCQTCIQKYDHHCFWIGNCVGKHNHRQFYLFLLVQSFNNWIEMKTLWEVRGFAIEGEFQLHWIIWLTLYSMLLTSVGFLCFTGYLAIYHTMLITLGLTTWEQMRRDKISYLKYLPKGYNPFSIGWKNNLKKFFTESTRANDPNCPLETWDKFLPTYQEGKTIKPEFNFIDNEYYSCC